MRPRWAWRGPRRTAATCGRLASTSPGCWRQPAPGEGGTPGLPVLLMHQCRLYRLDGDLARSIEVGEAGLRRDPRAGPRRHRGRDQAGRDPGVQELEHRRHAGRRATRRPGHRPRRPAGLARRSGLRVLERLHGGRGQRQPRPGHHPGPPGPGVAGRVRIRAQPGRAAGDLRLAAAAARPARSRRGRGPAQAGPRNASRPGCD